MAPGVIVGLERFAEPLKHQRMHQAFVGTEQILLGLMRGRETAHANALAALSGVDLAELRRRVTRALEHCAETPLVIAASA